MPEAYILDYVRTPFGKRKGGLSQLHPAAMGSHAIRALQERVKFDPMSIEDLMIGCVTQIGEQGLCIGRQIALDAGLPIEVSGVSINRFCGSGQQACNYAAQSVMSGQHDLVIGGGVESMTRVPMGSDSGPIGPHMMERFPGLVPQGLSAEMISEQHGFTRRQCDEFAQKSQETAAAARERGFFKDEIAPIMGVDKEGNPKMIADDEHPRAGTTAESLSALQPSFKPDGRLHAGNSSGIVDGAAAVLIGSKAAADKLGVKPRAKFLATAVIGTDPILMLEGPVPASQLALKKAGLSVKDIAVWEINEAFAPIPLLTNKVVGAPMEKINPNGGAIAIGHPLGASGARLVGTCLRALEEKDERYGLITMCIGFGMGIATIIDRKVN